MKVTKMTGQIIKRGKNTWLLRVFLGRDTAGKRKYSNETFHGPKKKAQAPVRSSSPTK
jgi:hypothetical protein